MPRLPDYTALGEGPPPTSDRPLGGYQVAQGGEAAARAYASVGDAVTKVATKIERDNDLVAYSAAQQKFLDDKLKLDRTALDDQDYTTLPDRYQAGLKKASDEALKTINSPQMREQFLAYSGRLTNFAADAVIRESHKKAVDAGRANTVESINAGIEQALQAADEPTRVAALQAAHDRIDGAVQNGWFNATEAAKLRKTMPEQFAERRAKMLIDVDPEAAYQLLAPPEAQGAPGLAPKPSRRVQIPESSRLAYANNNPGNLRFAGQDGASQGEGGFAKFETPEAGTAALERQVSLDTGRGATLGDFITKYAPPSENDTATYISQASSSLGVDPATPLSQVPQDKLVAFVAQKESGATISDAPPAQPVSAGGGGAPQPRDVVFPGTGDWRDFFRDPSKRMDLARQARQRADQLRAANDVAAAAQDRAREKAERDRAEAAANGVVTQLIKDPSKVDPVRDIANDPAIRATEKWSLFKMVEAATGKVRKGPEQVAEDRIMRDLYSDNPTVTPQKIATDPDLGVPSRERMLAQYDRAVKRTGDDPEAREEDRILRDLYGPFPTVTERQIAENSDLSPKSKERMLAQFRTANKPIADDKDTKTYGPGFYDLYQRIHLPDGDARRLTDPSELYPHAGPEGDLTVAGVDKLAAEIAGKRTPEGEAESAMKKQFFANARGQISGSNEGLHIRDPKGDELFLKFMAQVLPQYEAKRKSGVPAASLLDPDSKEYLGAAIKTFKRPLSQWTRDMLGDNAPPAAAAPEIDLETPQGLVAAYRAGKVTREDAERIGLEKGFIKPAAPKPPPVEVPLAR